MAAGSLAITPDVFDRICQRIAEGQSLRSVCRDVGMPDKATFFRYMRESEQSVRDQYARACEERCVALAEDAIDIADDGSNDWMDENDPENPGYRANGEHIQRSKLRVDTRKWFLSKLKPKVYGDKSAVELSGNLDIAQGILAARKRVAKKE
jgi:hypothetical protein